MRLSPLTSLAESPARTPKLHFLSRPVPKLGLVWSKYSERPAGQQFAPFQRPLEGTVKLGWRLTDWADEKGHAELVVSKNTNELKTGSPERFRLEVSRLG